MRKKRSNAIEHCAQSWRLDALEALCWEHVCKSQPGKNKSIEDFGYGKGYVLAVEAWAELLRQLEALQRKRGMHLVMIAHAVARDHKDPDHDAWKRWAMKLHAKSADVIAGWVDALLFAAPEMVSKKEGLKVRGFATGERLLYTEATGSHDGNWKELNHVIDRHNAGRGKVQVVAVPAMRVS